MVAIDSVQDHSYWSFPLGPCQFLFQESYISLIGDNQIVVSFNEYYPDASLFKCHATIDPGRVIAPEGLVEPQYHEVYVTFSDHDQRIRHKSVDVCHLGPVPPNAKGQSLLLLCNPKSPHGQYGPYTADKVSRAKKQIRVIDNATQKRVVYSFGECVRILEDGENK